VSAYRLIRRGHYRVLPGLNQAGFTVWRTRERPPEWCTSIVGPNGRYVRGSSRWRAVTAARVVLRERGEPPLAEPEAVCGLTSPPASCSSSHRTSAPARAQQGGPQR